MPLFEVAVIENAKVTTKDGEVAPERLVLAPTHVLAKDAQSAAMKTVMQHTRDLTDIDHDRMQVLVRPFA